MIRRALAIVSTLVLTVLGPAVAEPRGAVAPAVAEPGGGGELGPDYVRATAHDLGAGTFPGTGIPAVAPAVDPVFTWERRTGGGRCVVFAGGVPADLAPVVSALPGGGWFPGAAIGVGPTQGAPAGTLLLNGDAPLPPGAVLVGPLVLDVATPRLGGAAPLVVPRCVQPDGPLPPAPPSAAAIWRQTPLPRARVHSSPPGTRDWPGIVNLESRFWGDAPPATGVTVSVDGYAVDVAAWPIAYGWAFDDGTASVGTTPGDATAPLRQAFRRRGDHRLSLFVTWSGVAHTTSPALGLDFGVQDLGTVTLPVSVVHHVAEIRALLRSRTTSR